MTLSLIWAESSDGYIGRDGTLPWRLPEDMVRFRALSAGHPVVMGRATWDSLPARFRPLPGRENIVLSRRVAALEGARVVPDVAGALEAVGGRTAWVIGGAQVYAAFLPYAARLEVTEVDLVVAGDTPAPAVDAGWYAVGRDPADGWATSTTWTRYRFVTYERRGPGTPTHPATGER